MQCRSQTLSIRIIYIQKRHNIQMRKWGLKSGNLCSFLILLIFHGGRRDLYTELTLLPLGVNALFYFSDKIIKFFPEDKFKIIKENKKVNGSKKENKSYVRTN